MREKKGFLDKRNYFEKKEAEKEKWRSLKGRSIAPFTSKHFFRITILAVYLHD